MQRLELDQPSCMELRPAAAMRQRAGACAALGAGSPRLRRACLRCGREVAQRLEGSVPAILDGIVRAARQQFGDLGPPAAKHDVRPGDDLVLRRRPRVVPDVGVNLVAPAQAALLAAAAGHQQCDRRPSLRPEFLDGIQKHRILSSRPRAACATGRLAPETQRVVGIAVGEPARACAQREKPPEAQPTSASAARLPLGLRSPPAGHTRGLHTSSLPPSVAARSVVP
eukprot:scaffold5330_cov125-Isochrysis_galbana.AAC.11